MVELTEITIGEYIENITDYHANGAYEKLKENITLKYEPNYAIMVRTLNFEANDFQSKLIYLNEFEYNYLSKSKVRPDDIIMNKIASPGSVYIMPNLNQPASLAMNLFLIRFDSRLNQRFMYYLMKKNETYIKTFSNGTTTKTITKDAVRGLRFNVPNLKNQQKIATVLKSLDDKIELNNKINAELEAMAKTLYDYWFVQFDFPNTDGKPYKSSGGEMVYNEVLKREIPKGWEVTVFNDWVLKTKTGDWGKEDIEGNYNEHVYCVRGADINGLNGKGEVKAPARYILKNNLSKALQPNDFIIEISGGSPIQSTGRIALLTQLSFARFGSKVICSNFCKAISLKDEKYVFNFLQEWQRLYNANVFFGFEGKTSGIKNFLYDSFMDTYHIVKPAKDVAEKYYSYVQSLENKKQSNLKQNQELASLRDWLLPMLMNGQVTVKDVYERVEEELGMVAEEEVNYNVKTE
ncbi:hypothetical protein SRABI27_00197 [Pedobacter sp. Bi27]|uniref:restriction endonuclease subunit S n=1 Tax=Pedobacter sp. Bi27 TaxID=2822351 RepID=UPI001D838B37|nr:restriction endonuclease subunit S [Pedobacter sp. Bi27]CAH0137693.1 hypothetical protein SRABI27_00197 [Pedobacter sp. Bi27]